MITIDLMLCRFPFVDLRDSAPNLFNVGFGHIAVFRSLLDSIVLCCSGRLAIADSSKTQSSGSWSNTGGQPSRLRPCYLQCRNMQASPCKRVVRSLCQSPLSPGLKHAGMFPHFRKLHRVVRDLRAGRSGGFGTASLHESTAAILLAAPKCATR